MQTNREVRRVVIVGDGLAAWLTASAINRAFASLVTIEVVPTKVIPANSIDDSLGAPLVSEASLPSMAEFNRQLGYNEDGLLAVTFGGFTLGTAMSADSAGTALFNPFGEIGSALGPVSFQQLLLHARAHGVADKYTNYSLAALCAQAGRFIKPTPQHHPALASLEYGLQIDITAYAQMMQADAAGRAVRVRSALFKHAIQSESGAIQAVVTQDGARIDGDLFIDCSGPTRTLASQTQDTRFVDWSPWLPCDRISHTVTQTKELPIPFTHLVAESNGWSRSITLLGHRIDSRCFSATVTDATTNSLRFQPGQYANPWQHNCIALGGALATIDPTSSMSLHLLHSAIQRLITLMPNDHFCVQEAIEFNRQTQAELTCALDYATAHYKLNAQLGEPFWDTCRKMSVPDSLAQRIEVYRNCGRISLHDGEVVDRMNWVALFEAAGIQPAQYDVIARSLPMETIREHLTSIRQTLLGAVSTIPTYVDFLKQLQARA